MVEKLRIHLYLIIPPQACLTSLLIIWCSQYVCSQFHIDKRALGIMIFLFSTKLTWFSLFYNIIYSYCYQNINTFKFGNEWHKFYIKYVNITLYYLVFNFLRYNLYSITIFKLHAKLRNFPTENNFSFSLDDNFVTIRNGILLQVLRTNQGLFLSH